MAGRPRLLLVDDHHLILESLRLALQEEHEVAGMVATGAEAVKACRQLRPDLVLLDLSLPDRSGLEVISDLRQVMPEVRILIVTMHVDRILADASLQAGAQGFIPKDADLAELRHAIAEVLSGNRYLSPLVPEPSPRQFPPELRLGMSKLTPRQRDIVRKLGEGKSSARIGRELHLTPPTITFHRGRIRKTLGLKNEWELLRYALVIRMSEAEASVLHDRSA